METKLVRIAEISATSKHPIFTSVYHLINEDMLKQCHKELDGNKAVGIDKVTKDEYGKNLDRNIKELVQRLKNKSFKPILTISFCSNMAKSGMNPKTLQYIMGHADISVTLNTYTHVNFDDAKEEVYRIANS